MSPPETKKPRQTGGSDTAATDCSVLNLDVQYEYDNTEKELRQHFQPKKAASLKLAAAYSDIALLPGEDTSSFDEKSKRVSTCGQFLEFHVSAGGSKLARAFFCKDRLCPMCNWRRSLKVFSQMSKVMDALQGQGFQFLFLTLTVKNCSGDTLGAVLDEMQHAWNRMLHLKKFRSVVCGTFRAIEVTRNRLTGEYHPHYHVVLAVRPDYFKKSYIKQSEWKRVWRESCRLEYDPIVDIRTIRADSKKDMAKAVAETSKYAVKDKDYLEGSAAGISQNVLHLLHGLTQRKLCSWTGCFLDEMKKLKFDDAENGDLLHVGDELRDDLSYLIVKYHWCAGAYIAGEMQYVHMDNFRPLVETDQKPRVGDA